MKIVVCIKQVGHIYHPTAIDLATGEIDSEKMVFMLNPYDEVAVEEALRIKETIGDGEIILITIGSAEAEESLRYACSMGGSQIDKMIRIHCEDYRHLDPWQTALMLSKTIEDIGCDIILCGKKSIDTNGGQVGTYIAENLSLPQVTGIVDLEIIHQEKKAVVQRYLGKGDREEVECNLPCLFSVDLGLNDPRYPAFQNRILAENSKIIVIDPVASGLMKLQDENLTRVQKFSFPRPKTRKVFTPDSNLSVMDRMNAMISGGSSKKEGSSILEGDPDQLAAHVLEFLYQNKIL